MEGIKNKSGQITIFIILAILLVSAILLIFTMYNKQILPIGTQQKDTSQMITECINENVKEAVDKIMDNSGYTELPAITKMFAYPEGYYKDEGVEEIPYLCYSALNYARCIPQEPLLIEHLENEILDFTEDKIDGCFKNLKNELESQAYRVQLENRQDIKIELIDGLVRTTVERDLIQEKEGKEKKFREFVAEFRTPLYKIASISQEIINQESRLCNADYQTIMLANKGIAITKFNTGDDIKVYTIQDIKTKERWKFAIRGCVLSTPG